MRFIDFVSESSGSELRFAQREIPQCKAGQALVKVTAFGINRADLLQRAGHYPPPPGESDILGLEVAGSIVELSTTTSRFSKGDTVFGLVAGGGYAEYVAVDAKHLLPLPSTLDFVQGAAIAECFLTAYQTLFIEFNLQAKQTILVHAGASGVGLAVIQLAKLHGCTVVVTASNDEKLAACQLHGADYLIDYKKTDFVEQIKQFNLQIDLVVDVVGGDYLNRNIKVLNRDGTIIQLAMLGGRFVPNCDLGLLLAKRATLKASTLRNRSDTYKASLVSAFENHCLTKFDSKQLCAVIDQIYPVDELTQAHARMAENLNIGKLVAHW